MDKQCDNKLISMYFATNCETRLSRGTNFISNTQVPYVEFSLVLTLNRVDQS